MMIYHLFLFQFGNYFNDYSLVFFLLGQSESLNHILRFLFK